MYIDDILVFPRVVNNHMAYLLQVLTLLQDAAATPKWEKFSMFTGKSTQLGHLIFCRQPQLFEITTNAVSKPDETSDADVAEIIPRPW